MDLVRNLHVIFVLVSSYSLFAQVSDSKWRLANSVSYGKENNIGNTGFMVTNDLSFNFHKNLSVSARVGIFHSIGRQPEFSFSAISGGFYLNHMVVFDKALKFVRASAGFGYFQTNSIVLTEQLLPFNIYNRAYRYSVARFGYGLGLEGGGRISERVDISLFIQIYSYEIFGDIITIGPNIHIKL